jgi:xanthine dehydrogenase accessory factor
VRGPTWLSSVLAVVMVVNEASEGGYIDALGSRRAHQDRLARLREAGVDEASLSRVMGPIGLDPSARTPEEPAIAICAEVIVQRTGRRARSLRDGEGPMHQRPGGRS